MRGEREGEVRRGERGERGENGERGEEGDARGREIGRG